MDELLDVYRSLAATPPPNTTNRLTNWERVAVRLRTLDLAICDGNRFAAFSELAQVVRYLTQLVMHHQLPAVYADAVVAAAEAQLGIGRRTTVALLRWRLGKDWRLVCRRRQQPCRADVQVGVAMQADVRDLLEHALAISVDYAWQRHIDGGGEPSDDVCWNQRELLHAADAACAILLGAPVPLAPIALEAVR